MALHPVVVMSFWLYYGISLVHNNQVLSAEVFDQYTFTIWLSTGVFVGLKTNESTW